LHRLLPVRTPTRWWSPRLSPGLVRACRPVRRALGRLQHKIAAVEVRGGEHLESARRLGGGVLVTSNHFGYADVFAIAEALDRPFYSLAAWQVLGTADPLKRWLLRRHGVFTVDRDGQDLRAFRQGVEILRSSDHPLVIFPEGEMYHVNDRVMPFEEGAAAIALAAARRGDRPVVCLPCAVKYAHIGDPTPLLLRLMDRLEARFSWRPEPGRPLEERIYRFAEGALSLKELEYLGKAGSGPLPGRIAALADAVLRGVEGRCGLDGGNRPIPARVKVLRRAIRERMASGPGQGPVSRDLDDVHLALQLYTYPGDYVAQRPTIDRIAETLDKLEEDVFGIPLAPARGLRRVTISFGEPIAVGPEVRDKATLTELLERRVQGLIDAIIGATDRDPHASPTASGA
jgi:1-acyl-sn-glycerol-3-phosphate acyltransferase